MRFPTLALCLIATACSTDYNYERLGGRSVGKDLCPTGCSSEVDKLLALPMHWEQLADKVYVSGDDAPDGAGGQILDDPCALLPQVAGDLCSFACDPDMLVAQIPKGQCVDIHCALPDGRVVVAGGCAAPDA